jgi:hypothetical protein
MKMALLMLIGLGVVGMAYSLAPDIRRYIKIKSM